MIYLTLEEQSAQEQKIRESLPENKREKPTSIQIGFIHGLIGVLESQIPYSEEFLEKNGESIDATLRRIGFEIKKWHKMTAEESRLFREKEANKKGDTKK